MMAAETSFDRSWHQPDRPFGLAAIATSAGGLDAVGRILKMLPADFSLPLVVSQHLSPDKPSQLVEILGGQTRLRVKQAQNGESLSGATVYVSPPGHHVLVWPGGTLCVFAAPRLQFVCPSADLLFESVARAFGERSIAVILTGMGRDGAVGAKAVRMQGGFVIAQDQATSQHFDMPYAAIETRKVDLVLPIQHIAFALTALADVAR